MAMITLLIQEYAPDMEWISPPFLSTLKTLNIEKHLSTVFQMLDIQFV